MSGASYTVSVMLDSERDIQGIIHIIIEQRGGGGSGDARLG